MRIAQTASRYHYAPDFARGLFLYEHRRCYNKIIDYCNKLCYYGKLRLQRGTKASASQQDGLPAMGYLHINGMCQQNGGSQQNLIEAETIAAWLVAHEQELKKKYDDKPLHEIVGVVTPFGAQVRALTKACVGKGIKAGKMEGGMTIGTVHSFQGAERPVVIFSPVYSKLDNGSFIDRSTSLLNVAVSRAKNSFLVFGDMDVFERVAKKTPRGLLASYLFCDVGNAIQFEHRPEYNLRASKSNISQLRDAQEHDKFLLEVFSSSTREIHIVTPWIKLRNIRPLGFLDALHAACERGVQVTIYTDFIRSTEGKNIQKADENHKQFLSDVEELFSRGAKIVFVERLHSKVVIGDDNLYCIGSFNWFSASRNSLYSQHETSLLYRGFELAREIEAMRKSLEQRIIPLAVKTERQIGTG